MESSKEIEFLELLHRNKAVICKVCWQFAGNDEFYFKEYRQEIHLVLWNEVSKYGLDRFKQEAKESTWVYKIAYNAACAYKRGDNCKITTLPIDNNLLDVELDEDELKAKELLLDIAAHLDSNRDRRLLEYKLQGLRNSEIAERENVLETVIHSRMTRLIQKMRDIYHRINNHVICLLF